MMIYVSSAWAFPLPFGIVVSVIPFIAFFVVYFLVTVSRQQFIAIPTLGQQLLCQVYIIIAQAVLVLVYPIFSAVFTALSPTHQAFFMLVLPLVKVVMKNVVAWASSHLEEFMPEITVFSVEVFNALYVAVCMQNAGSRLAAVIIILFDAFHAGLARRSIHKHTTMVSKLKKKNPGDLTTAKFALLAAILGICQQPDVLTDDKSASIRLRSPIRLQLSSHNALLLESFVCRQSLVNDELLAPSKETVEVARPEPRLFGSVVRVVPVNQSLLAAPSVISQPDKATLLEEHHRISLALVTPVLSPEPLPSSSKAISSIERIEFVHETLKLLFHCEYLVLVEYIECAIPLLYVLYISVLFHLPSAQFCPHTRDMTASKLQATVVNLLVYIWLEVLSFLGLHFMLKWKFGSSPAYLLAFVLERQMQQLQSRLFVWIVYILQFTLEHFGVDFSFKFAWMHT